MKHGRLAAAVVGTGFVGPFHVDAVRRGGYGEVVVVAGSDPERTRRKAQALGVARATTDVASILDDPEIDVVHICTPNDTHVDLARRALWARAASAVRRRSSSRSWAAQEGFDLPRSPTGEGSIVFRRPPP